MSTSRIYVICCFAVIVQQALAFVVSDIGSCRGHCNARYQYSRSCQCNDKCSRYGNCCYDYQHLCSSHVGSSTYHHSGTIHSDNGSGSSVTLGSIADQLWKADQNKFQAADLTMNYGGKTKKGSQTDEAPQKLFTHVNEEKLQTPFYQAFMSLLNNYDPNRGAAETTSPQEQKEIAHFMNLLMATDVMKMTYNFLSTNGNFDGDMSAFRQKIHDLWFKAYSRSGRGRPDSSGFEHVFVGSFKGSEVEGFHNWLRFYLEEKSGNANYLGHMTRHDPILLALTFTWDSHYKAMDSFFVGSSPAFEMAIDTICILTKPNSLCKMNIHGIPFSIQTWDLTSDPGLQLGSAYTVFH